MVRALPGLLVEVEAKSSLRQLPCLRTEVENTERPWVQR
jgi:hypothetical protein